MSETFQYIPADDTFLFVRKIGSGDPVVVVHGGPGLNHHYLLPYMDALANKHELIYFDQRYCGESEANLDTSKIHIEQWVEDIESLRKGLGLEQMTLLAHSFGAHLAFRYALKYPQRVSKIISVCGLSLSWVGVGLFAKEFLKRTKPLREQLEEIRLSKSYQEGKPYVHRAFYKLIFSSYCYDPCSSENINLSFTNESARNGVIVSQYLRDELFTKQFDLTAELNALDIPILAIQGIADPYPADKARADAEALKNGYYIEFEECGHFPFMEQPKKFNATVNKFLTGALVR